MASREDNYFHSRLFKPSKLRDPYGTARVPEMSLSQNAQDTFGTPTPTGSFKFDPSGAPFKNTQQLNVDFSKFENHTFFNSARGKTHVAIEKIINRFPFDGSRAEHEKFFNGLTGYEKHVFDMFPKNTGFLIFSRSLGTEGTYLSVKDVEGLGDHSGKTLTTGKPKLNFGAGPFSAEFSIYVPSGSVNDNEVIAQRLQSEEKGFTIALSSSLEKDSPEGEVDLMFALSDTQDFITSSVTIKKGKFHQFCGVYDRGVSNKLLIFLDGKKVSESSPSEIGGFDFSSTNFLIGTGSSHKVATLPFVPKQTLSGALDEFRFFLSRRTQSEIDRYKSRELYSQDDLHLYFRFNEPSGSFSKSGMGNNSLVLDYSGNGLHTFVSNFNIKNRDKSLIKNANSLIAEDPKNSPILFPSFESVQSMAANLIFSASEYDANNPNLITRMVPKHYLDDSATYEGFSKTEGDIGQQPGITMDRPGGNLIRQSQMISSVLFTWAAMFDEIKMFIDELGRLHKVDPIKANTVSDQMIAYLARFHGFTLPTQFNSANLEQFLEGRALTVDAASSNNSLQ